MSGEREPLAGAVAVADPPWARRALIAVALGFLTFFLLLPVAAVFTEALRAGARAYFAALADPMALAAMRLTALTVFFVVPLHVAFGLAAAWALGKFRFRGRMLVNVLIELPFSVSPVIAGMVFVLLFGAHGWLGPWLAERDIKIIFALPGILLATLFVTVPIIARELVPVLEAQGSDDEEAALTLGASGWQTFFHITLPRIRWALFFAVVLCAARAMGEFGAVSVVSGHIRGRTNTLPLHVEILYNEYQFQAAFAVSSALTLLAGLTLVLKVWLEGRRKRFE